MSDLYLKFNEMNLQLHGDQLNLIKTKTVVKAFIDKLSIFHQNLGRGEYRQFPNLDDLKKNGGLPDDVIRSFCDHLSMLHEDMCERYRDISSMTISDWVLDPFTCLAEVEVAYQEELIEMQANEELKPKMKGGYTSFWLQQEIRQLERLNDVKSRQMQLNIFAIPFNVEAADVPDELQHKTIQPQSDDELNAKCNIFLLLEFCKRYLSNDEFPALRRRFEIRILVRNNLLLRAVLSRTYHRKELSAHQTHGHNSGEPAASSNVIRS
ncbi:hypothetical protein TTRE_0000784601 [Trichuris trichiura]|uniref:Uncharacterized protein n=1 Tax=Trichuris trichiura TaxID=36087 RepID=A0A077ZGR5_TRITR|nr:hypothetical protein TTRE_0000784601 [Trichuris trichiura]